MLLQAPRLEDLADTVLAWCAQYPPAPLEEEVVLVPSNGMAEWFKGYAATQWGVFAGARVDLPARWAWGLYEIVMGPPSAGERMLDKAVTPWVLWAHWPQWASLPSVRAELSRAGLKPSEDQPGLALWRWCTHAADLFDQYQLYRGDWLEDWSHGRPVLRLQPEQAAPAAQPMAPEHRWQAELWAWLMGHRGSPPGEGEGSNAPGMAFGSRAETHRRCVQALRNASPGSLPRLPARVVLFGTTSLPHPHLELLEALSNHLSVVLAVPNPCRVQWVDLEHAPRQGQPLLAAWGRQARDFLTQLERFDDRLAQSTEQRMARVEREDESPAHTALHRLQRSIHLNEPLAETALACQEEGVSLADGSIRLVQAHTALREVEALHDHLLHRLATADRKGRIQPHQVVVMVPDLGTHLPAVRAVFGGFVDGDPRHIPWGVADQQDLEPSGLLQVADWLLSLPAQRGTAVELHALLQIPALCARWALDEAARRDLQEWVVAGGIRWGVNQAHRDTLGLGAAGQAMTWRSGVDRMLHGYASLEAAGGAFDASGPAPLAQVRGLSAQAAGVLAALLSRLEVWLAWSALDHEPADWAQALRTLWHDLFRPQDPQEERESQAFQDAVTAWLRAIQASGASARLSLPLVRESLGAMFRQPRSGNRFRSNGVTFCTLMPLRAIPFEIVCMLGMNDGAYPRSTAVRRGDLLAEPELARPGDRSRRTDDRQLMLDAVLSARQELLISWVGRRASDNEAQPPSVMVSQCLDVLGAIWGEDAVRDITVEHPLQPYSPAYFFQGRLPATHQREWSTVGEPSMRKAASGDETLPDALQTSEASGREPDSHELLRWLRCPVAAFWEDRLGIRWRSEEAEMAEEEPMDLSGWNAWAAWDEAIRLLHRDSIAAPSRALVDGGRPNGPAEPWPAAQAWAVRCTGHLQRMGLLPLGAPGELTAFQMRHRLAQMHHRIHAAHAAPDQSVLMVVGSKFLGSKGELGSRTEWRIDLLLEGWWRQTLQAARGKPTRLELWTPDATACATPLTRSDAVTAVQDVTLCVKAWMSAAEPMPATVRLVAARHQSQGKRPESLDRHARRDPAWHRSFGLGDAWARQPWEQGRGWQEWEAATDALYGAFWHWCVTHVEVMRAGQEDSTPELMS